MLVEKAPFWKGLALASCVAVTCKPPCSKLVRAESLDLNHAQHVKKNLAELAKEASMTLWSCIPGGRRRNSETNAIDQHSVFRRERPSNSPHKIVDCADHLAAGAKKEAAFVANMWFVPHDVETSDPNKTLTDCCVFFDGTSDVQMGGKIIEAKHPHNFSVLHGVEHVLFHCVLRMWPKLIT